MLQPAAGGFQKLPNVVLVCLAIIVVSVLISIPGSYLWGHKQHLQAAGIAITTLPFIALAFCRIKHLSLFLTIFLLANIAMSLYQYSIHARHVTGLSSNENVTGGLIVILTAYLAPRRIWLLLPAVLGVLATTSTGAMFAMYFVVIGVFWLRGWIVFVALGAIAGGLFLLSGLASEAWELLRQRWVVPEYIKLWPQGPIASSMMHSVPLRIGVECGSIALVAWLISTVAALRVKLSAISPAWLAFAVMALISMWEYSTFEGQLAPFWWLFLGVLCEHQFVQPHTQLATRDSTHQNQGRDK